MYQLPNFLFAQTLDLLPSIEPWRNRCPTFFRRANHGGFVALILVIRQFFGRASLDSLWSVGSSQWVSRLVTWFMLSTTFVMIDDLDDVMWILKHFSSCECSFPDLPHVPQSVLDKHSDLWLDLTLRSLSGRFARPWTIYLSGDPDAEFAMTGVISVQSSRAAPYCSAASASSRRALYFKLQNAKAVAMTYCFNDYFIYDLEKLFVSRVFRRGDSCLNEIKVLL